MPARIASRLDAAGAGLMLVLCLVWGLQQVATKLAAAHGLPPLVQLGVRSTVAGVLVCLWVAARQGRAGLWAMLRWDRSLPPGIAVGLLFTAEFAFLFEGVIRTTASHAVLLLYTTPFFTAVGAHLFIPGERLTLVQLLGLICAFAGVAVSTGGGTGLNQGDLLVLAGAALWGATTVTVRATRLAQEPAARVLLYQLAPSGLLLLAASVATGGFATMPGATAVAWASLAYQTVVVAFVSYLTWFWLLTRYSPRPLSAFTLLTPLIGITAGAVLLGEHIPASLAFAFILVAAGLRLVNGPFRSQ